MTMKNHWLAIEIGGTKLQLTVGNDARNIIERKRLPVDPAQGAAGIRDQIERQLKSLLQVYALAGIGVGFGGPVCRQTGQIARSHQIEGWSGFALAEWLRMLTGIPVTVDNDANVAALGEARRGAGRGFDPVFYVTLGSGVGGGLVVGGEIYHGATPGESEIGHLRLDPSGSIVESRCSGWAVDRRIRELKASHPESVLATLVGESAGNEAQHLAAAVGQGDPIARQILRETAETLAFALSHVVHLMHPQVIILGGGLSKVGEPLRDAVAQALPPFLMEVFRPGPRIVLAALGEDAVPVGALELALRTKR
jgi:glucokinase